MRSELVTLVSTLAGVALSFAAVGCGSGTSGSSGISVGTCGVIPCGGEVVGSWQASSACVDRATLDMDFLAGVMGTCPGASLGAVSMTPSGMVSFAADATFTGTLGVSSTVDVNFPGSCFRGASCDLVTKAMQTIVGTNGVTSVSCAGSGSCLCTIAQTMDHVSDAGTWATSGTTLALAGATSAQSIPYCVEDTSLHLLELDMPTAMMVIADVALTRQ